MSESNNQMDKFIGVEVTNSAYNAVCLDKDGNLTGSEQVKINKEQESLGQLIDFLYKLKDRFGSFERLGVAVPGLIHLDTKKVAFSTFIPEHAEVDLLSELENRTGFKITIENDANAAGYGEFRLGAGRGSRSMLYVTLGAGVGGALIFDGKIWHGTSGFAGEFGHIAINSEGMKLEDVASSANIIRRTRNRFHQDHTSSLVKLEESEITVADVAREAEKGDDFAQLMLERTGTYVGTAIAGVINLLNIERIVIGGEIMRAAGVVLEAIKKRTRELSFAPSFAATQIVAGELGENAAAAGAALLSAEQ